MHKKVEADTNASTLLLIARGTSEKIAIPNVIRMQIFSSVEPSEFVNKMCNWSRFFREHGNSTLSNSISSSASWNVKQKILIQESSAIKKGKTVLFCEN